MQGIVHRKHQSDSATGGELDRSSATEQGTQPEQ
jgi:hypothetical protein